MEKLKVLMVIAVFYPYTGGAEKQAQKLAAELVEKNIDVTVVTGRWDNNLKKSEEINGFKIIRNLTNFNFRRKAKINTSRGVFYPESYKDKPVLKSIKVILRKIFLRVSVYIYQISLLLFLISFRKNYDILHVHQIIYPAFISTLCANILKKPVIAKVGSSGFNSDINQIKKLPEGKLQLKYILKNINKIVYTSKVMKEEFIREGADKEKMVIIHNGVKAVKFNRSFEFCNNLVNMGRFIKSKDLDTLLSAFSELTKTKYRNLKLILIGDGPERKHILNLIQTLKLDNRVILTGMIDNPLRWLKEADLFVFTSIIEGLSNSLIEAMSCKLPCIVTDIPGNLEVIGENESSYNIGKGHFKVTKYGALFNPSDAQGLITAMEYLINNSSIRKQLGENAYAKIMEEYNIGAVADRYIELYREVLGK